MLKQHDGPLKKQFLGHRLLTVLSPNGDPFGLVFLDPPYRKSMGEKALAGALAGGWLADDALVVWEENAQQVCPKGFTMLDARKYGDTWVHVLEVA